MSLDLVPPEVTDDRHREQESGATHRPADYVQAIFEREMGVTLSNMKAGSPRDEAMRRLTEEAANLYAKRVLRELIQNAFDGAAGGEARILVRLDLRHGNGTLYVANSGRGFTSGNVDAVSSPAMSNKTPGNFIGHKGLGFRSVELLSDEVEIHSMSGSGVLGADGFDGFCFRFASESDERDWLDLRGEAEHASKVVGRVHRLQLPVPIRDASPETDWFAGEGYATLVRLPLRDASAAKAAADEMALLMDAKAPITLFLDRLSSLTIERVDPDGSGQTQTLVRRAKPVALAFNRPGVLAEEVTAEEHRFLLARMPVDDPGFRASVAEAVAMRHPVARWGEWKGTPEVSIALPLGGDARRGVFYAFLPMDREAPFNGCIDAPFYPDADRRDLDLANPLNRFLLDQVAELGLLLAGALADAGETRPELAAAAVDAVSWIDCGDRLLAACDRLNLEPGGIRLPTMRRRDTEGRWARLDEVYDWPDDDFQQIDRAWMVRTCDLPMLPRRLGERRMEAVAALAATAQLTLEANPFDWAAWAPALAADLAKRRKLVRGDWEAFYADLAQLPEALEHLHGAAVFRLEDGSLGAANPQEGHGERELFISPSAEGATGRSRRLGSAPLPPDSVAKRMVFADPGLSWPPTVAAAYIKAGLATRYDLPRVLARLKHLLGSRPRQASIVAALGWAFVAWRDHRTPEVEQAVKCAGLSVPAAEGGTKPARLAYFGAGWRETRGDLLSEFLALAPDTVRSVKHLRDGLLPEWEAWPLRERGSLADWVQFLRLLGVRDGPGVVYHSAVSRPIVEWVQLRRVDEALLPGEARIGPSWRAALRTDAPWAGIRYQSGNYTTGETLYVLPGQAEHPTLSDEAKLAYARLIVASLTSLSPSVLQTTLTRVGGNFDSVTWPSPAKAFLTHGEWLPVGSDDEVSWRAPPDCWYAPRGEQLPRFVPRISRWARDGLDSSKTARELATGQLGLRLWNETTSAPARLGHLGAALVEGISEADYDAFRKAHREAWEDWHKLQPRPALPAGISLVVQGAGRPMALPVTNGDPPTVYVGDGSDPAREQLVSALEHHLISVPPGTANDVAAALGSARKGAFTLLPDAKLAISADGVPISPSEETPALVQPGSEWLAEIAVLVLEFNDTLSSRNTARSRRALYDAFSRLRLLFVREVTVELDERSGPLPASLDGILALPDPEHPTIVVEHATSLDWSVLARIARALSVALGRPSLSLPFRVTFLELERRMAGRGTRLERPSDNDIALALGHPVGRIREVQRSLRSSNRSLFEILVPAVHVTLGHDAAEALRRKEDTAMEDGEIETLLVKAGADPQAARRLVAASHSADSLDGLRRDLGIDLVTFNRSLVDLGPPWQALRFEERLRRQFAKWVEARRGALEQQVRDLFVGVYDRNEDLEPYNEAKALGWAVFDPAWSDRFADLSEDVAAAHVEELIRQLPATGEPTTLAEVDDLRRRNRAVLHAALVRIQRVVAAWAAKAPERRTVAELSLPFDQVARRVIAAGVFDFREIAEDSMPAALARAKLWPEGMATTTTLKDLGLHEADLDARRKEEDKARQEELKEKRTITFGTIAVDGGAPGRLQLVAEALDKALSSKAFQARSGAATLLPIAASGGGGGGGSGSRKPPMRDPEYSSEEQRVLLGFAGEFAAYRHLKRTIRNFSDIHWISSMGRSFLGLPMTDDRDGYDFHVPRSRGPDLFFEVKAHTGDPGYVDLERSQVEAAISMADGTTGIWTILYVPYVRNPDMISVQELLNPYAEDGRRLYRQRGREAVRLEMRRK